MCTYTRNEINMTNDEARLPSDSAGQPSDKGDILIAINLDEGLYNFRAELLRALIDGGYRVHLALPEGDFSDELRGMGCILHYTKLDRRGTNPFKELSLIAAYGRVLGEVRPKVVLTYTIKPNIYMGLSCRARGIPYIATITGLGTAVSGDGPLQKLTKFLYRLALGGARRIFFQNRDNMELFGRLGINTKAHALIPGSGVNLDRFSQMDYPEGGEVSFLFISRIMKEKGIGEYMETAAAVRKKHPEATFRVLGFMEDDYDERELFQKAVRDGDIIYEGSVPDVRPFLQNAECTLHPSCYPEGMSNVCLESAACGRAVITTDRVGCRDTVIDGESGFIVPEHDAAALTEAVLKFIALPRSERRDMGLRGRQYMEERFDRRLVTKAMLDEIDNCR